MVAKFNNGFRRFALSAALGVAASGTVTLSQAATMQSFTDLPTANCGTTQTNNCIQFGDFNVYSLALLYNQNVFQNTGTVPASNPNPGQPFYVGSAPGELGNNGYIVLGTGTNNSNVVTNGGGTLIDDARSLPTGTGAPSSFVVGAANETGPAFAGDLAASWDGRLTAIRTELGTGSTPGGKFVIYFNLNETGQSAAGTGNNGMAEIDLLSWLKVTLEDEQGLLPTKTYYLTGSPGSTTAPNIATLADPNWVTVHGTICISPTAGFLGFGECTAAQTALGGKNLNQNLGANQAAFGIYNEELSNLVLNSGYDIIRANYQLAEINNGFEQVFSALTNVGRTTNVPEPSSLALAALGLGMFAIIGRRRRKIG